MSALPSQCLTKDEEITHLRRVISRLSENHINPPGVILDDMGIFNELNDYVSTTKRLRKKPIRKILQGLVRK